MKAEERFQTILSDLNKRHLIEFVVLIILMVIYATVSFWESDNLLEKHQNVVFIFSFGFIHILASNLLAFAYNLNWVILPFAPKVSPKFLKIFGAILIIVGLIFRLNSNIA